MQEAKTVYHAESAEQAKEAASLFGLPRWGEMAPESVVTFERVLIPRLHFTNLKCNSPVGEKTSLLRARQSSLRT